MKSTAALLVIAVLLALLGSVLWVAGDTEQRIAAAQHTLVTLRYGRAVEELTEASDTGLLAPVLDRVAPPPQEELAAANYWSGNFEALRAADDVDVQLLAANAEYRALRAAGGPWQSVVGRLDAIARRYTDVLRADPANEDAAYNLEYVVRLRGAVMKARQPLPAGDRAVEGLTLHGSAGAPPLDTDAKKFRMIVPMMPDERQEAEEAGRSGQKLRKG
jgi:hypothetical protein